MLALENVVVENHHNNSNTHDNYLNEICQLSNKEIQVKLDVLRVKIKNNEKQLNTLNDHLVKLKEITNHLNSIYETFCYRHPYLTGLFTFSLMLAQVTPVFGLKYADVTKTKRDDAFNTFKMTDVPNTNSTCADVIYPSSVCDDSYSINADYVDVSKYVSDAVNFCHSLLHDLCDETMENPSRMLWLFATVTGAIISAVGLLIFVGSISFGDVKLKQDDRSISILTLADQNNVKHFLTQVNIPVPQDNTKIYHYLDLLKTKQMSLEQNKVSLEKILEQDKNELKAYESILQKMKTNYIEKLCLLRKPTTNDPSLPNYLAKLPRPVMNIIKDHLEPKEDYCRTYLKK